MQSYTVFFEIFGKKLKYKCKAKTESEAKEQTRMFVAESIVFVKTVQETQTPYPGSFEHGLFAFLRKNGMV